MRRPLLAALALACGLFVLSGAPALAAPPGGGPLVTSPAAPAPTFLGQDTLPTGTTFRGTEVGGLSGLTYDARRGVYYAISDDRSERNPARFYTLRVTVTGGTVDLEVVGVTTLLGPDGRPFAAGSIDPEGIALTDQRSLVITREGDASRGIDPFVREFSLEGRQVAAYPLPGYVLPRPGQGVRNNLALESAGITPNGQFLFTGTENALVQDGPEATVATGSPSRLLRYNLRTDRADKAFVYPVAPVPAASRPSGFATNGLVDVLPLGPTSLIALERGFSTGVGNSVSLYTVRTGGATDVLDRPALRGDERPVRKDLLLDLGTLGVTLDNLEGLAFGPTLPDGRRLLLVISDNNFSATQTTQLLAFAL